MYNTKNHCYALYFSRFSSQPIDWFDREKRHEFPFQYDPRPDTHWIARIFFSLLQIQHPRSKLAAARKKAKAKKKRQEMSRQEPKHGEWRIKYTIDSIEAILISYYINMIIYIWIVSIQEAHCNFSLLPPGPCHPYLPQPPPFSTPSLCFLVPKCLNQLHFLTLHPQLSHPTSLLLYSWFYASFLPYVLPPRVLKSFSLKTCSGNAISGSLRAGSAPAKRWKRDTRSLPEQICRWCNGGFILLI